MQALFVYGTLLPGLCRYPAMAGAQWLGSATLDAQLFDLGPYPAVVQGCGVVHGQVAWVDDALLARLDAIEEFNPEHPEQSEYIRERMTAKLANGQSLQVWVYVFNRSVSGATRIAHGDYLQHLSETGYVPTLDVSPRAG